MRRITRKQFVRGSVASALLGVQVGLPFGVKTAWGGPASTGTLIVIFLRGACDALNFVTPLADADRSIYEAERPNLQLAVTGGDAVLRLHEPFGLHPNARGLFELYQARRLAIVHAVGMPNATRSHFASQSLMEQGTSSAHASQGGWLSRYLLTSPSPAGREDIAAMTLGPLLDASLYGFGPALALENPARFDLVGPRPVQMELRAALRQIYAGQTGVLTRSGAAVLTAMDRFETGITKDYAPAGGADYPDGDIGGRLKTTAQLLKHEVGMRIATIDMGGWDTHRNQGAGSEGRFAGLVKQLSQGIHALLTDCDASHVEPPTIVVMSEFGRRLKENASRGTDHGHGGMMLVAGKRVKGGQVYGTWPGLANDQLFGRADLATTTDYRQVLSEVLLGLDARADIAKVFPAYQSPAKLGIMS